MKNLLKKIYLVEFEYRIFVSLSIVLIVYVLAITVFKNEAAIAVQIASYFNIIPQTALNNLYLILALSMSGITILRMWAGSILTSKTVMSFSIQADTLLIKGPYLLVRNPIYLADLLAMSCFALCLPAIGIMIPFLFYLHYTRLIKYEEISLKENFKEQYNGYINDVPRLLPTPKSLIAFLKSDKNFVLNADGIRHNALYALFIPGFIIAAIKNNFLYALMIGLPAVIDWAVIHTKIGLKKSHIKITTPVKYAKNNNVFDDIVYAQCWEDPACDRAALNIQKDDIIFSITSGGCNVLTFLLDNPAQIIALDLNPHQNYLLELKIAAFKCLPYFELLEFLGINPSQRRLEIYQCLHPILSQAAGNYWHKNHKKIFQGIIHCGRYEKYMHLLRMILKLLIGNTVIKRMYNAEDPHERLRLYQKKWENIRWKIFTKILLSRKTMSLFFNKSFFTYLYDSFSFGEHFAQKVKRALTYRPLRQNYFLNYILLGNHYPEYSLPYYLQPQNFNIIRARLDRIRLVTDNCEHYFSTLSDNYISKFNFSNIFEWISCSDFEKLLHETIRIAKNGAILTYRNLLVHRECPLILSKQIKSHKKYAAELYNNDLSFIYNNYVVEEIQKDEKSWPMKSKE